MSSGRDLDLMGRDIAEAQRATLAAQTDVEGIEVDAAGWDAPDVENAAQAAREALEALSDALTVAFKRTDPPG